MTRFPSEWHAVEDHYDVDEETGERVHREVPVVVPVSEAERRIALYLEVVAYVLVGIITLIAILVILSEVF
jgi:hypothetical protein